MKKNKLGQEPAFPNDNTIYCQPPDCYGMSKRFYAVCCAMQGLMSTGAFNVFQDVSEMIDYAYKYADELLKQEMEEKNEID